MVKILKVGGFLEERYSLGIFLNKGTLLRNGASLSTAYVLLKDSF